MAVEWPLVVEGILGRPKYNMVAGGGVGENEWGRIIAILVKIVMVG